MKTYLLLAIIFFFVYFCFVLATVTGVIKW